MSWPQYVLLGIALLAVILAVVYRANLQNFWMATKKFLREVRVEMQKVTWPTRSDIYASTVVVLISVVVLSVIISAWDQILSLIVQVLLAGKGA